MKPPTQAKTKLIIPCPARSKSSVSLRKGDEGHDSQDRHARLHPSSRSRASDVCVVVGSSSGPGHDLGVPTVKVTSKLVVNRPHPFGNRFQSVLRWDQPASNQAEPMLVRLD
jgi:hypothetical protein